MAREFASRFDSGGWGWAAGLLHDMGKGTAEWQKYLVRQSGFRSENEVKGAKVEHSAPSAKLAERFLDRMSARVLSYCIAGHHAGLPDWSPADASGRAALVYRLCNANCEDIPEEIRKIAYCAAPGKPPWKFLTRSMDLSMWIRMLFSCLVDADFLDTERYMQAEHHGMRGQYRTPPELLPLLRVHMEDLRKKAPNTKVNRIRSRVLQECSRVSHQGKGMFSLSVPTGGGKTLASMLFALQHAVEHHMDRVIYVIPYTSIIEQNAGVFKDVFGEDQVIEHHVGFESDNETAAYRLACENWDAPVIVTTTVQFFESLFASKPSRCRKLHNIVNSVLVFDEAQLLPSEFLAPVLDTLELLVNRYDVSCLISTATQPAFESREGFRGFKPGSVREIISDPNVLSADLSRVMLEVPPSWDKRISWVELADELIGYRQVLCVVSDRRSCFELYNALPESEDTFHLSALMCGSHRSHVIAQIKDRLEAGEAVKVISTQLIEAGVDLDFPVVYRALAGLDSIAQAAGRCNREGRLEGKGKVVVFQPERRPPIGILRKSAQTAESIMRQDTHGDVLRQENFELFFRELYWKVNSLDSRNIRALLTPSSECGIQFRTASSLFKLIDDSKQVTILVPYGAGTIMIEELRKKRPYRTLLRKLQRYAVNVYQQDFQRLCGNGSVEEICPDLFCLINHLEYDQKTGLRMDEMPYDPDDLMV